MADQISARTWRDDLTAIPRHLVIDATTPGDQHAHLSVYLYGVRQAPGVLLDPAQLREIAADLTARADLMENNQ